jgi:protein tyrosine/serine phosphatase
VTKPFPRCFWVKDGCLLAGYYAGDADPARAREKLRKLRDADVDRIIDLTEEGEYGLRSYADELQGIEHTRLAIPDFSAPSRDEMARILDTIDEALEEGRTVYLHCYGGVGRTGTVVGCYLRRHRASAEEALDALEAWRAEMGVSHPRMPESPEQIDLIRNWEEN